MKFLTQVITTWINQMKILKFIAYLLGDFLSSTLSLLKFLVAAVVFLALLSLPVILVCYGAGVLFLRGLCIEPADTVDNFRAGVVVFAFVWLLVLLLAAVISIKRSICNAWKCFNSKG